MLKHFMIFLALFVLMVNCDFDPDDIEEVDLLSELSIFNRFNEVFESDDQLHQKVPDNDTDLWEDCLQDDSKLNGTAESECDLIKRNARIISIIRIVGYSLSLSTLSLIILLIIFSRSLHRPRNIMHTNLFFSFVFRTVLTIISVEFMESPTSHLCKLAEFLFRYSGAVYHVAIFAEAFYVVSILHYPFYTVKVGYKLYICISWFLPLVWMTIWVIAKAGTGVFVEQELCWKPNSLFKLILKIPETFILLANLFLAFVIIKAIKSRLRFSAEKKKRFTRLAKSILILLPIIEIHFFVFTWTPFLKLRKMTIKGALVLSYIESIFYGYMGFMVFLIYAFIQRDIRVELMNVAMKIIGFFSCCCNIEDTKLSNFHKTKVKYDLAKAYPFKFHPVYARNNSKVDDSEGLDPEQIAALNQLTL